MESLDNNSNTETNEINTHEDYFNSLKIIVESLEEDVLKSKKGNKSASVRLRKNLRSLKTFSQDFIKFTLGKSN